MENLNSASHLLFRAEGLAMSDSQKKSLWEAGRGVPIGISPLGIIWYCYRDDGSESIMRARLDNLWNNCKVVA